MAALKCVFGITETDLQKIYEVEATYGISMNLVKQRGAGGWPEFEVKGSEDALRLWYTEWYCGGDESGFESFDFHFKPKVKQSMSRAVKAEIQSLKSRIEALEGILALKLDTKPIRYATKDYIRKDGFRVGRDLTPTSSYGNNYQIKGITTQDGDAVFAEIQTDVKTLFILHDDAEYSYPY